MSTKIATRSSSGLRPQGTGGQTVQQAYQAIVHYLRRALSESHALLLAEPNPSGRGGMIDWYSEASDPAGAVAIGAAPPERRAAIYARLAALMNDIRARAEELKNSSRQSERLLGQMLLLALEIPNEECLFVVGDQPVLIFWGYLADAPSPQSGVIDRLIAESRRPREPRPSVEAPPTRVVETPRAEAAASIAPAPSPPPPTRRRWLPLLLWLVFAALCLAIGLDLLYACGMGLPWQASMRPLLIDYCPAPMAGTEPSKLGELESQNQILQGQLDRLLGAITARRQQCAEGAGGGRVPGPVSDLPTSVPTTALPVVSDTPLVAPLPVDTPSASPVALDTPIQIPTETDSLDSLAGCWGGPATTKNGSQIQESFCFDGSGQGMVTIERPGGIVCKGRLKVRLAKPGPRLVIDRFEGAKCPDGDDFSPIEITCAPDRQGRTRCAGRFEVDGGRPWDIELRRLAGPAGQ